MASEATLTSRLTEVNTAITALLNAAPIDHKSGDLTVTKSAMLRELFAERRSLEDQLAAVPAEETLSMDSQISRFGVDSSEYEGYPV